jgi:hypothetical protein
MTILRNLARNLWNAIETKSATQPEAGARTLQSVRQERVPPVLGLSRFRDGFEQFPQASGRAASQPTFRPTSQASLQRDGFDAAPRKPVDLSGAFRAANAQTATRSRAATLLDFSGSLSQLAALL